MKTFFVILFFVSIIVVFYTINRIQEKWKEDDSMLIYLRKKLEKVFPDINHVILLKGDKSYTINKKTIYICLVDIDGKYYEENMLTHVVIHELAHKRCPDVGHTETFHKIFKEMLEEAAAHGLYDPTKPLTKNYCEY